VDPAPRPPIAADRVRHPSLASTLSARWLFLLLRRALRRS
jgi:hypothetical protein